ncbi:hypothetical protein QUF80_12005 [Desulfococcaceae bacterium HSG8]|nr:hypothetical protein [Desulfococcaceae bacterium HSG8]
MLRLCRQIMAIMAVYMKVPIKIPDGCSEEAPAARGGLTNPPHMLRICQSGI